MKNGTENTAAAGMVKVDFFWRAESNRVRPQDQIANSQRVLVPAEDAGDIVILMAKYFPGPLGSHRSGCFEVQTDAGIFSRADSMKIDLSTPRKAAKVEFKTWEQLDEEMDAEFEDEQ